MKKLYPIGQVILIIGSVLYVLDILNITARIPGLAEMTVRRSWPATVTLVIGCIYAVALVLMLLGWLANRREKKA